MEVQTLETIHPKSCLVEAAKEGLEHQAQQYCASAIETYRAENQAPTPCFNDREPTHAPPCSLSAKHEKHHEKPHGISGKKSQNWIQNNYSK